MQTIKDIDIQNKRVLIRVGFNVPAGEDGEIDKKEAWRIKKGLPTIKYLLKRNCKIILATHFGRPDGKVNEQLRLGHIQNKLSEFLGFSVIKIPYAVGPKVERVISKMWGSEVLLLENLRFYPGEEKNDLNFAKKLAKLADIYVNDAFSVCHRKHASIVGITKYLPSYAGLLLEKEICVLSKAINNPKRPATIIIGGTKVKTKVPVIEYLLDKFDNILVGGVAANAILKAKGIDIGSSLFGNIDLGKVRKINFKDNKLHIPVDAVACNNKNKVMLCAIGKIGNNKILDIGSETAGVYSKIILGSKTVIWNGPMGKFEQTKFSKGTKEIARAIAKSKAHKIIGGGETVFAASKFNLIGKMDFVSTGGGAMLEFLAGKELPGLKALGFKN